MTLMDEYRQKCVSADKAVKVIQSGDWIEFAWGASHSSLLADAIARRKEELTDVNIRGGVILKPLPFIEQDPDGRHFTWNSMHMSGYERSWRGRIWPTIYPIKYSEVPSIYGKLLHRCGSHSGAPMDQHGYFNFGVTISHYAAQ